MQCSEKIGELTAEDVARLKSKVEPKFDFRGSGIESRQISKGKKQE